MHSSIYAKQSQIKMYSTIKKIQDCTSPYLAQGIQLLYSTVLYITNHSKDCAIQYLAKSNFKECATQY